MTVIYFARLALFSPSKFQEVASTPRLLSERSAFQVFYQRERECVAQIHLFLPHAQLCKCSSRAERVGDSVDSLNES